MPGFKVLADIDDKGLKYVPISSLAVTTGDLLEITAGSTTWAAVTSSSNYFSRKAIAMETVTSSATQVLVYELNGTEQVEVDSAITADSAHNGDRMLATDKDTVNNIGTDNTSQNVVFVQEKPGSTTTRIIGRVIVGVGVDPDAT